MGPSKEDTVKASVKAARVIASVDSFTIGKLTSNFGSMISEEIKQGEGASSFEGGSAAGTPGQNASSHATATDASVAAGNEAAAAASAGGDGSAISSGSSNPAGASFPNPTGGDNTTGNSPKKSKGGRPRSCSVLRNISFTKPILSKRRKIGRTRQ